LSKRRRLDIGLVGVALESKGANKQINVYFPELKEQVVCIAKEDIREATNVIVIDANKRVKELSPQELKYLTAELYWKTVSEFDKLPVTEAHLYDDYALISFTAQETSYTIGSNAHEIDHSLPESFEAKSILLFANQNCWVRFGANKIQHYIRANTWYEFNVRTTVIYVVRDTVDGTLELHAEG